MRLNVYDGGKYGILFLRKTEGGEGPNADVNYAVKRKRRERKITLIAKPIA